MRKEETKHAHCENESVSVCLLMGAECRNNKGWNVQCRYASTELTTKLGLFIVEIGEVPRRRHAGKQAPKCLVSKRARELVASGLACHEAVVVVQADRGSKKTVKGQSPHPLVCSFPSLPKWNRLGGTGQ